MGNPEKAKRTAPKSAGGTAEGRFLSKNGSHSIANRRSSDNIFQTIKSKVTTRDAAEFYGLKVGRNGMACCPCNPRFYSSPKESLSVTLSEGTV
jgi:hypothetical protein